jgi:release factor glutamine methyltransferase
MTIAAELIDEGYDRLSRSPAIDQWPPNRGKIEAEALLAHVLGEEDPDDLDPDRPVDARRRDRFRRLVRRRAGGEPMAHILGWTRFRDLRLTVRPGAFVPRQSSEFLAEQAVRRLRTRRRPILVDLATGAGPVALAAADEVPRAEVHGTDLLATGVHQARANARRLGLRKAHFYTGDLYAPLPRRLRGKVDVVTIHPPYVPKGELHELPLEVRGFEPVEVLTDHSEHGLELVERTADEGWEWLRPGGWVLVEVSPDRARPVKGVLQRAGYRDARSTRGWPDVTRVIAARA